MNKVIIAFLLLFASELYCQTIEISLDKILSDYCFSSPEAIKARLNYESANYSYENYKKGFLPSIAFNVNPASFNRSFRVLQNPTDGSYSYIEDFANNSSIGVSVSQKIGITGGSINMGSNLNMLNEFYDGRKSFGSSPFTIDLSSV